MELVILKQLPILEEQIKVLSGEIQSKIDNALSLKCDEESKVIVKKVRADLTKDLKEFDGKKIEIKNKIMQPYNDFDSLYKEYISDKLKKADTELKTKIDLIENAQKEEKKKEVKGYFIEYLQYKNIDFVTFETVGLNITLTATEKALKEQVKAFIDKVSDDLALIETQEFKAEIMVEYKKSLNVSSAITTVANRHKEIEVEQAKIVVIKEVEAVVEVVEKVEQNEKTFVFNFEITTTTSKIAELKKFLESRGYQYEHIL